MPSSLLVYMPTTHTQTKKWQREKTRATPKLLTASLQIEYESVLCNKSFLNIIKKYWALLRREEMGVWVWKNFAKGKNPCSTLLFMSELFLNFFQTRGAPSPRRTRETTCRFSGPRGRWFCFSKAGDHVYVQLMAVHMISRPEVGARSVSEQF